MSWQPALLLTLLLFLLIFALLIAVDEWHKKDRYIPRSKLYEHRVTPKFDMRDYH